MMTSDTLAFPDSDAPRVVRPVRMLTYLLIGTTVLLLTLGALTTSFRSGMADPVWPTEPWFLVVNGHKYSLEKDRGFLLEHTHRAAGFLAGFVVSLLALWTWATAKSQRWVGLILVLGLLMTYGGFHRQMGQAWDQRQARQAALAQGLEPPQAPAFFPLASGVLTASSALLLLSASVWHLFSRDPGKWVRAAVSVLLVAVMIQGLLGGYRVYLDQLLGQELSQVHGVFAQLVFTLMCTVPLLWRRPVAASGSFPFPTWLVVALPVSIVIQLIWGVMIRHHGGGLSQRLHMLTAFPVFALAILIGVLLYRIADRRLRPTALVIALKTLVLLQVVLGVEAYLGKFAALGAQATLLPAAREVTVHAATIRSLHVLVGTALLAISTLLAVIICRSRSVSTIHSDTIESDISRTYSPHIQEWEPANRT